jgi:hypothetical protein
MNGAIKPIFILVKLVYGYGVLTSSKESCIIIATGVVRMQATPAERAKKQYLFQGSKREETRTTRQ